MGAAGTREFRWAPRAGPKTNNNRFFRKPWHSEGADRCGKMLQNKIFSFQQVFFQAPATPPQIAQPPAYLTYGNVSKISAWATGKPSFIYFPSSINSESEKEWISWKSDYRKTRGDFHFIFRWWPQARKQHLVIHTSCADGLKRTLFSSDIWCIWCLWGLLFLFSRKNKVLWT